MSESLRARFQEGGQGHVFDFFGDLDVLQQKKLVATLESIDVERCNAIFKSATKPTSGTPAEISPLPSRVFESIVTATADQKATWNTAGLHAVSENKVAVILLAGGQGTRLGSSAPKGCYDIGLPSGKSLFQLQAERILAVQRLATATCTPAHVVVIPWYVMTSGPTRKATEDYFQAHNFFGLNIEQVFFFEQAFTPEGKFIMESKDTLSVAPDGNGGIYAALETSGVIADLEKRGIPFVHAYCVDNCLVKVADPVFIGFCIARDIECGVKSVIKRKPTEPVGVICLKNGKYSVVEYSEIDKALSEQVDETGSLVFRAANIANHFYTTAFLKTIKSFEDQLEYHVASKKIKFIDQSGTQVSPLKPNGIKLELFIFDVLPFAQNFSVLETLRSEEFSPLKNAAGCVDGDSPDTSRSDILTLHCKFARDQGAVVPSGLLEISPDVSYAGEGLEYLNGITVNRDQL